MSDFQHTLQIVLLATGGVCMALLVGFRPGVGTNARRALLAGLVVIAALSVASHFRFGKLHRYGDGSHVYHFHDQYHYLIGAKYYPQLGYYRLYDCTLVAMDALRRAGETRTRTPPTARSLANPDHSYAVAARMPEMKADCHAAFGEAGWEAFETDIRTLLEMQPTDRYWAVMMFDLGFNPPPTWSVLAHPVAKLVDVGPRSMEVLPFLDILLLFVVAPVMVYRAWGLAGACAYLTVLGCNWLASWGWTGGSYWRQVWMGMLMCGLSLLKLGRHGWAGLFMGLAASLRIFPLFFAFGAALALAARAWRSPAARPALARFVGALAATGGVLVVASLVMFDTSLWQDFLAKIGKHGDTWFVMHVGFKKYAVFSKAIAGQDFWWAAGLHRFVAWQDRLQAIYRADLWWFTAQRLALVGVACALALRRSPPQAALVVGGTLLFVLSMPANYYYVYLAAFPVVFCLDGSRAGAVARILLVFGLLAVVAITPLVDKDALVHNGYINIAVFWFWVLTLATLGADTWWGSVAEEEAP